MPRDPVAGILAGLERFAHPEAIRNARLGTTIATNAVLERKGAVVAYVTTKGFRDVIFIQRGNRKSHYDMSWVNQSRWSSAGTVSRSRSGSTSTAT